MRVLMSKSLFRGIPADPQKWPKKGLNNGQNRTVGCRKRPFGRMGLCPGSEIMPRTQETHRKRQTLPVMSFSATFLVRGHY